MDQLEKAIKIVSFNLFINIKIVSLLISGLKAETRNSLNKLNPLKCKLIIS